MGAVFLAPLYLLMNLYLAVRILLWFRIVGGPVGSTWVAAVFVILFLTATVSPLPAAFSRGRVKHIANRISNYWLGILMYLLIFLLLSDAVWGIFCLITHRPLLSIFGTPAPTIQEVWLFLSTRSTAGWQQKGTFSIYLWGGAVVLAATAGFFTWGIVHARSVRKVTYPVTIHKECRLPVHAEPQRGGAFTAPANRDAFSQVQAQSALAGICPQSPIVGRGHLRHSDGISAKRSGAKNVSTTPALKIALVADLHLGYSVGLDRVQEVIRIINDMEPDLVVFAGDLFDNAFDAIQEPEACAAALASIKSTYGSYACWGNHDVEERILAGFTFDSHTHEQNIGSDTNLIPVNRIFSSPDSRSSPATSSRKTASGMRRHGHSRPSNGINVKRQRRRDISCTDSQSPYRENSSGSGPVESVQANVRDVSPMAQMLRASNIRLLEDETVLIGDAFYLAGRLDASYDKKSGHFHSRKTAAELAAEFTDYSVASSAPSDNSTDSSICDDESADSTVCGDDSAGSSACDDDSAGSSACGDDSADSTTCGAQGNPVKPFLVIDHQPSQLNELAAAGADLILSGHTHDGQMFPANLITRLGWMNSYGKLEIGTATSIVTSGAGTWGPPIRVGTSNEVAEILVTFEP